MNHQPVIQIVQGLNKIYEELKNQRPLLEKINVALQEKKVPESRYVTTMQAAKIVHRSKSTVVRWLREGRMKGVRINGRYLILREELDRFVQQSQYGC